MNYKAKKDTAYWHKKSEMRRLEIKVLKGELKKVRQSRDRWKRQWRDLHKKVIGTKVRGHHYPLHVIWLGVLMYTVCGMSLRGISKALYYVSSLWGEGLRISPLTIRNWGLRVGLYMLLWRKFSGRYVLILDESVSIGQEKIMLILGVKAECKRIGPLRLRDAEVLALGSKKRWTSSDVSAMISQIQARHEISIAYAISDKASVLTRAVSDMKLPWVYDCTHLISSEIQKIFEKDDELNGLVKCLNTTRTLWPVSRWAAYMPPTLRKKARFHQILVINKWALRMLGNFEILPQEVQQELTYLKQYSALIHTLDGFHQIVDLFASIFKTHGICRTTVKTWRKQVKTLPSNDPKVVRFGHTLTQYVQEVLQSIPGNDQRLCCSDVIESMFGKYKNKIGPTIISDDILKMVLYPNPPSKGQIAEALAKVSIKDLLAWKKEHTEKSLLCEKRGINSQKMAA